MVVSSGRHIATEGFTMHRISTDRSGDLAVTEYTAYRQSRRYASRTVDLYRQCLEDFIRWRSRTSRRGRGPDEALVLTFIADDEESLRAYQASQRIAPAMTCDERLPADIRLEVHTPMAAATTLAAEYSRNRRRAIMRRNIRHFRRRT
jgi:hypothetical protein